MKILKGIEIPIAVCVSYTLISVTNALFGLFAGRESGSHMNTVFTLIWCSIAVFILAIHPLFDEWPPAAMILIQYVIAMGLVLLTIFLAGFFGEISKNGYRDAVVSFTIPYIIGAACYYVSLFKSIKNQNKLLLEINRIHEEKEGN